MHLASKLLLAALGPLVFGPLLAHAASAADDPAAVWATTYYNGEGDGNVKNEAALSYGVPDSEETVLSMRCVEHSGELSIFISDTSDTFKPGQKTTVSFSVGVVKASFPGEILANEMSGIPSAEVKAPVADPVFQAVKDTERLTIAINTWSNSVPLKGASAKMAEFITACSK
jgi:hypothetical protein